ncbi:hypothetical protein IWX50DRAFT_646904 [Phyllosticta citricarpa]
MSMSGHTGRHSNHDRRTHYNAIIYDNTIPPALSHPRNPIRRGPSFTLLPHHFPPAALLGALVIDDDVVVVDGMPTSQQSPRSMSPMTNESRKAGSSWSMMSKAPGKACICICGTAQSAAAVDDDVGDCCCCCCWWWWWWCWRFGLRGWLCGCCCCWAKGRGARCCRCCCTTPSPTCMSVCSLGCCCSKNDCAPSTLNSNFLTNSATAFAHACALMSSTMVPRAGMTCSMPLILHSFHSATKRILRPSTVSSGLSASGP